MSTDNGLLNTLLVVSQIFIYYVFYMVFKTESMDINKMYIISHNIVSQFSSNLEQFIVPL